MTHKWIQDVDTKRKILGAIDRMVLDVKELEFDYNEDFHDYFFTLIDALQTIVRTTEVRK